jgi:hypothetical protein
MHADLQEAIDFHEAIIAEGAKALVGYEREKVLANTVLLSEIPTTYDSEEERQVNAGNLLLRGVPGVGKTFFGVILAAISGAKFARLQGRADLQPTEVVGFQMINPATGQFITEFGPLASAEVILLDEPTSGLDPKSGAEFLDLLSELRSENKVIWMTTHDIFRAKAIADRIGIMVEGHLVKEFTREELEQQDLEKIYVEYVTQPAERAA